MSTTIESQLRRAGNRKSSAEIVCEHGLTWKTSNMGVHLQVMQDGMGVVADLWPGTGKYQIRGKKGYRRGVFNMLKDLGVEILPQYTNEVSK